jgi:hypothetical protein
MTPDSGIGAIFMAVNYFRRRAIAWFGIAPRRRRLQMLKIVGATL